MIKNQRPVSKQEIVIGNLVLVCDHTSKSFQPRFKEDFRVVGIKGNTVEVKNNHGLLSTFHSTDVRKTTMAEKSKNYSLTLKKLEGKGNSAWIQSYLKI